MKFQTDFCPWVVYFNTLGVSGAVHVARLAAFSLRMQAASRSAFASGTFFTIGSLCILNVCNFSYFPFWF